MTMQWMEIKVQWMGSKCNGREQTKCSPPLGVLDPNPNHQGTKTRETDLKPGFCSPILFHSSLL